VDIDKAELMGLDDKGRWMPFAFDIDCVIACKLTSDDEEMLVNGCTTIFTEYGDTYIIDTPYVEFQDLYIKYNESLYPSDSISNEDEDELDF
jgi:hypothetical protein